MYECICAGLSSEVGISSIHRPRERSRWDPSFNFVTPKWGWIRHWVRFSLWWDSEVFHADLNLYHQGQHPCGPLAKGAALTGTRYGCSVVLPSPSVYISHSRPIVSSSSAQIFTVSPQCGSGTPALLLGRSTRATIRGHRGTCREWPAGALCPVLGCGWQVQCTEIGVLSILWFPLSSITNPFTQWLAGPRALPSCQFGFFPHGTGALGLASLMNSSVSGLPLLVSFKTCQL